jgi:hypothetical protein
MEPARAPGGASPVIEVHPHRPRAVLDAFVQVEIRQRIAGLGGADLVREAEGAGFLVGLVAVEQQARAQAVGRLPEILDGVLHLGVDDVGGPLAPARGGGREGPQRPAFAADGVVQVGHLVGEARRRHDHNIRR